MRSISGFFQFAKRVLGAAKSGGLGETDSKKLDRLLERTGKRNAIIAKSILSAMSAGGASERDVSRFGEMLQSAELKISKDKEPFTKSEKEELQEIFRRAYISTRTARWLSSQIDGLLAEQISEVISGSRIVPSRKVVRFEHEEEKKRMKV